MMAESLGGLSAGGGGTLFAGSSACFWDFSTSRLLMFRIVSQISSCRVLSSVVMPEQYVIPSLFSPSFPFALQARCSFFLWCLNCFDDFLSLS